MPYDSNPQLPEAVQNSLSESDQSKWRKIFNSAYADTCDGDDICAAKIAWSQMKKRTRHFAGWATAEVVDKQGDKIEIGAFKSTMQKFMKLGATIIDKHSNRKVGSYIDYEFRNKDENAALWMEGVIYKGQRIHDETWDKIKSGEYPALSIGADPLESKKECDEKTCWNAIKAIDLFEISVVDSPANPEATIEEVNHVVKTDDPTNIKDNFINKSTTKINTIGDSMADKPKEVEKEVEGGEPVAESTEKESVDSSTSDTESTKKEQADIADVLKSIDDRLKSLEDKAFPPEEEEEEEEKEDGSDEEEEEEETEEKSTEVASTPSATLTIKDIKKAIKDGVKDELKKLTAKKEADTPRPDLKKHEMTSPLQKIQADPAALGKMSTKEIDAMIGVDPKVGERPW